MANWLTIAGTIAGILGFVLALKLQIEASITKRRERNEEKRLYELYQACLDAVATGNGNAWHFEVGSDEFKLAEKMVERGMMNRLPMGYYTVCGVNLQR